MEPNTVIAPGLEVQSENDWDNTDGLFVNGGTPPRTSDLSGTPRTGPPPVPDGGSHGGTDWNHPTCAHLHLGLT